jgi:hypothetical protein
MTDSRDCTLQHLLCPANSSVLLFKIGMNMNSGDVLVGFEYIQAQFHPWLTHAKEDEKGGEGTCCTWPMVHAELYN